MSITTLDGIIAGRSPSSPFVKVAPGTPIIGSWYDLWLGSGSPGAGATLPTGNLKGQFYTCAASLVSGQIPFTNPPAGDTVYLARFAANCNTIGTLILADRIWADSVSATAIGNQVIYSGSFPRSSGIGGGDSSGTGLMMAVEVFSSAGASANTPKITYVNSAGTAGDTGTALIAIPSSAAIGTMVPIGLKSGAFGVRSITGYNNMTTHTSGALGIVVFRPIVRIGIPIAGTEDAVDAITSGFPILYPNMVPMLIWVAGSTTIPTVFGGLDYAVG
jgi:hypothetical protein